MGEACSIQPMGLQALLNTKGSLTEVLYVLTREKAAQRNTTYISVQLFTMSEVHTGKWGKALTQENQPCKCFREARMQTCLTHPSLSTTKSSRNLAEMQN